MSHTIGQAKQDNQPPNSNSDQATQDLLQSGENTPTDTSLLSDADYEFLFNQLLEGIGHGWHDRRIIKFFNQLGDRGQQEDWIAWLERVKVKLLKLPTQSKRQLGTIMIRLGELTQSATEVKQIGAVSHNIGRELLFGDTISVIWEYDGSDMTPVADAPVETESELSERLPANFAALGEVEVESSVAKSTSESDLPITATSLEDIILPAPSDLTGKNSNEGTESLTVEEEPVEQPLSVDRAEKSDRLVQPDNFSEPESEPQLSDPEMVLDRPSSELSNAIDAWDNSKVDETMSVAQKDTVDGLEPEMEEQNLAGIDIQQIMNLIREDQQLAQQILQRLNNPLVSSPQNSSLNQQPEVINQLDKSSLELVESWFNLGLKQVSAGEFDKAIASWEKALKINPDLSEAWHNRGSALGRLGKYEAAVESFQNALAIDSYNYQAWNDRAHALYQLQNWSEAIASWDNAVEIMPGNHLFWYNRGCALEQLEKWSEAIASYEKALEIKPDFQPGRSRYINLVADNSRSN